jgi:hypothetical protein
MRPARNGGRPAGRRDLSHRTDDFDMFDAGVVLR